MNLSSLTQLLQNKVTILQTARGQAYSIGDINQLNAIDADLLETQNTLAQLSALSNIAQAAASVNTSLTDVAASGIAAVQDTTPTMQGPSASAVINGYDLSAYATDPLYEDKIRNILSKMPTFSVVGDIDAYIQAVAPGSPVTGDMVYTASQQYGVDLPLMMAIMQNDSDFGTLGVGATTLNPGNVGNTGTSTQAFPSWNDGVDAVANWLNNHRVVMPTATPTATADIAADTTAADATSTDATSTPAVTLPTTPVVAATSTATFIIPTINATTTPIFTPATAAATDVTSTAATSTDTTGGTNNATPPPDVDSGNQGDGSSDAASAATSTDTTNTATSTPITATSTPPDSTGGSASSAPSSGDVSTSTPGDGTRRRRFFNFGNPPPAASSTDATSTDPTASAPATSTAPVVPPPAAVPPAATSTPDTDPDAASTTQAIRKIRVKNA